STRSGCSPQLFICSSRLANVGVGLQGANLHRVAFCKSVSHRKEDCPKVDIADPANIVPLDNITGDFVDIRLDDFRNIRIGAIGRCSAMSSQTGLRRFGLWLSDDAREVGSLRIIRWWTDLTNQGFK